MICYPVIIPTLCRYEHFKRCVESLERCTHAENTELIIGLDYPQKDNHWEGYRLLCEYIPTIKGFKNVICFKRGHNWGAIANGDDLVEYAFKCNDAVIFSEDDNEFSPCFLDYMNKVLEIYKDEEKIVSVSGYTHVKFERKPNDNISFSYNNSAWGIGLWKDKEDKLKVSYDYYVNMWFSIKKFWMLFSISPAVCTMFTSMIKQNAIWGDVMRTVQNIDDKTYQVIPYKSMVRNWGYDGSGVHCNSENSKLNSQYILQQDTFDLHDSFIKNSIPRSTMFYFQLSDNKFKACCQIIVSLMRCSKWMFELYVKLVYKRGKINLC